MSHRSCNRNGTVGRQQAVSSRWIIIITVIITNIIIIIIKLFIARPTASQNGQGLQSQ